MSKFVQPNGDDHPAAAEKHLTDAKILLGNQRFDGAAYLSGYVVECSLKAVGLAESGGSTGTGMPLYSHDVPHLLASVMALAAVAGAKTAKYIGPKTKTVTASAIATWSPSLRYRAPAMNEADATEWYETAAAIFYETVGSMMLDGVL